MIDIENQLFTELREFLLEKFPVLSLSSIEERLPPSFPHVSVVEADNSIRSDTVSSLCHENHVNVMYEVNIYSNSASGRKSEAKAILSAIDLWFVSHGFARTSLTPTSLDNASLYRIIVRYSGCVGLDNVIYRR